MAGERNKNPADTLNFVDRDRSQEIRYRRPKVKTRMFVIVDWNGFNFPLDSAGNSKVAQLARRAGAKSPFDVTIAGQMESNTLKVDSISTRPK